MRKPMTGDNSRSQKTRLYFCLAISAFSMSQVLASSLLSGVREKYPLMGDLWFIIAIAAAIGSLMLSATYIVTRHQGHIVLLSITLLCILVRSIPNLRLAYPPLHDPYYYIVGEMNISDFGVLKPEYGAWYPGLGSQLTWPITQLLSSLTDQVSGLNEMDSLRFMMPLLSALLPISIFLLSRLVHSTMQISLVAALLASSIDMTIFYQSEFHPQGLALSLFFIVLYFSMKVVPGKTQVAVGVSVLLLGVGLVLAHHFTSMLVAVFGPVLAGSGYIFFRGRVRKTAVPGTKNPSEREYSPALVAFRRLSVVALFALAFNLIAGLKIVGDFVWMLTQTAPQSAIISYGSDVPIGVTVLGSYKWLLVASAVPAIISLVRWRKPNTVFIATALTTIFLGIGVTNFLSGGPTDRFIAFLLPLLSIFSAACFTRWHEKLSLLTWNKWKRLIYVTFFTSLALMSVLNSQIPAVYFNSSEPNSYYWYSNDLSTVPRYAIVGDWIRDMTPNQSTYSTEFDTLVVPFFYSNRPISSIDRVVSANPDLSEYAVLNPSIHYEYYGAQFDKVGLLNRPWTNVIYNDGKVFIANQL